MVNFAVGSVLAVVFVVWELRRDQPMLDVTLFRGRGFSAGSITLTLLFFAMAGTVFLQAQYLQVVLGYTPLVAGFAIVPAAIAMLLGTGAGSHLATMHGARVAVTAGTLLATAGIAVQAAFADGGSYLPTGIGLFLFGLGAGMAMPAATEVIMAGLPPSRAGVGSAVNDTVREFGGALGVAVIGSVAATSYASSMGRELARFPELTSDRPQPDPQQRRRCDRREPPTRWLGRRDRISRHERLHRFDAHLAVDRHSARLGRRLGGTDTAAAASARPGCPWTRRSRRPPRVDSHRGVPSLRGSRVVVRPPHVQRPSPDRERAFCAVVCKFPSTGGGDTGPCDA